MAKMDDNCQKFKKVFGEIGKTQFLSWKSFLPGRSDDDISSPTETQSPWIESFTLFDILKNVYGLSVQKGA